MFSFKLLLAVAGLVCVSARHIVFEDENRYYILPIEALEDMEADGDVVPTRTERMRREIKVKVNPDAGTAAVNLQKVLAGSDESKNKLGAFGTVNLDERIGVAKSTAGLALENVNGHGLELSKSFMPKADQLNAAGHVNLFENKNHKVDANAFISRTMPKDSFTPDFNTYGGGIDYKFKDTFGAGVSVTHTPLWAKTDYGATGNLNIYRDDTSSLDFKGGLSRSESPYMPRSSWEPNFMFTYNKEW